jgi:ElaB/YqjD/DUF883 family membrane-anchored ribosome-binding protein
MTQLNTLRSAAESAHAYAERAIEAAEDALSTARTAARHRGSAWRERSRHARERAVEMSAAGGALVREHPVTTLLIGVAAVGLTLAVLSLLQRRDR